MTPDKKTLPYNQSLRIQLSLASLMFFSPFVKLLLKKSTFEITDTDLNFVGGYLKLGWVCIFLLGLSLCFACLNYLYPSVWLNTSYLICMVVLVIILIGGTVGIFTDTQIIKQTGSNTEFTLQSIQGNKRDMLLYYLPFVNIYYRYTLHEFDHPNPILKESLLIWALVILLCFVGNIGILSFFLILIVIRVVTLMSNIDIIPQYIQNTINKLYYKNPEEIAGYGIGSIVFIFASITNQSASLSDYISLYKKPYSYLFDIKKFGLIQGQYILAIIVVAAACFQRNIYPNTLLEYIAWGCIGGKYILMLWTWQHVPALPGFREIITFFSDLKHMVHK